MAKELELATDKNAEKASLMVAQDLKCAGGCGKGWFDSESHWSGFLDIDGVRCCDPVWRCGPCFCEDEARKDAARDAH